MGVAEDKVLDDELKVDQAAHIVLDIEPAVPVRAAVEQSAAHRHDLFAKFLAVPRSAEDYCHTQPLQISETCDGAENFVYQPENKKAAPLARGGLDYV
jgi:hypothetical protein